MEEAIEATILLVVLLTFAVLALAYAAPQLTTQLRRGEIKAAIATMMVASEQMTQTVTGDPSGSFNFNFLYGTFSLAANGRTRVLVNGNPIYDETHYVFEYKTNLGGYPAAYVADRGEPPQAYYGSVEEASLTYHYSHAGETYVIAEMKIALAITVEAEKATVHILIAEVDADSFAVQRGPIGLLLDRYEFRSISSYAGPVTLTLESGVSPDGTPLTSDVTVVAGDVSIFTQIVYVNVQT